ncbi:hypothetical protein SOVF_179360 [Spinacia oleracea]|nr:hypothetical protein SOVF_179360 [Spinacia oleracea]
MLVNGNHHEHHPCSTKNPSSPPSLGFSLLYQQYHSHPPPFSVLCPSAAASTGGRRQGTKLPASPESGCCRCWCHLCRASIAVGWWLLPMCVVVVNCPSLPCAAMLLLSFFG